MGINWVVIIIVGVVLLALLMFLIFRNQKDEESFEHLLNEDYKKSKEDEGDIDETESFKS
jgi:hypothetical protein